MSDKTFKPLALEDFNLSEDDLKTIVEGAQTFLPPVPDEGVDTTTKKETS